MNHFKKKNNKLEKLRGIFFQMGLIIAGGLTLLAFEWTSSINPYELPAGEPIAQEEWDYPVIIPEKKVEKPEVKYTEVNKKSEILEIVKTLVDPEPNPEPVIEPVFDPTEYNIPEKTETESLPVSNAEIMPEFEGGLKELYKYLGNNLKYPKRDKDANIEGTVYLQFIVGKKGNIKDVKILRGVSELMDKEAIRVVKAMPKWKAGKQGGRTVSVIYNLPIKFKIAG